MDSNPAFPLLWFMNQKGRGLIMTLTSLQALTWGTVAGAVLSALLLAAAEGGLPELARSRHGDSAGQPSLPSGTTEALSKHSSPRGSTSGGLVQRHDRPDR